MTPEASSIPEQPKEAAKSAVSALKEATSSQPEAAAQDAAAAAKDILPEAPKELPNPFQGFFSGAELPPFMQHLITLQSLCECLELASPVAVHCHVKALPT